jgi:pyrroline-5-carboxylate reductase
LQIVGGGKMGQALLGGLIRARWADPAELAVVEALDQQRERLEAAFPSINVLDEPQAGVDTIVAVKPHLAVEVAEALQEPTRVISIAAGVTIGSLEGALPAGTPVVRVMPNTPSLVGFGAAGVAGGSAATDDDVAWAVSILEAVGEAVIVPEHLLDAVTGLSGSGPAYVFLVAEALLDAGVSAGLPAEVSATLANQTLLGAATLLLSGQSTANELRAGVTTPAGTTAAGLRVLEQRAVRAAFIDAVQAATDRSRQLGGGS